MIELFKNTKYKLVISPKYMCPYCAKKFTRILDYRVNKKKCIYYITRRKKEVSDR